MTRAREAAEFTIRQVEEVLFPHVGRSSLVRLEDRQEVPTDKRGRARAALVLLLYGFELTDFGVSDDDLPAMIDTKALAALREQWHCSSRVEQCTAADLDQAA